MQCHLINFFRKYAMERGAGRSGKWPAAFSGLFPLLVPWLNILRAKLNDIAPSGDTKMSKKTGQKRRNYEK